MRTRDKRISLRATDEEYQEIKIKAASAKMTQTEFLLSAAHDKKVIVRDKKELDPQIMIELKRIGNNINQITKAIHSGKTYCGNELKKLHEDYEKLWQLLK